MAKILVIDDDTSLLKMLGIMLERAGHQPILISQGLEGIKRAISDPPDLAIVDVMMPDVSGHEVCQKLRANPATVDIPILILTARSQPVDRDAALTYGANDFLGKPVAPKDLTDKVDELLKGTMAKQRGRVITIFSLRGGVGVTTLAINLAASLRTLQVPNITLVDLSPNAGHIALQLRVQPQRTWEMLLTKTALETNIVRSLLINHPSGINILAAPVAPTQNASLTETQLIFILKTIYDRAEFVIIDAPPTLSPMCIGALKSSDLIILVLSPDIAAIQTATGTMRALVDLGVSGKKLHLLLNHPSNIQGLPKQTVERALKRPVSFEVPFDPSQFRALSQGKPLSFYDAESELGDAMKRMAQALRKSI
ncbi:MAG: response regulator [Anaerolineales bacterium]|nr:response regulator [Anaerolineales bacterium]